MEVVGYHPPVLESPQHRRPGQAGKIRGGILRRIPCIVRSLKLALKMHSLSRGWGDHTTGISLPRRAGPPVNFSGNFGLKSLTISIGRVAPWVEGGARTK